MKTVRVHNRIFKGSFTTMRIVIYTLSVLTVLFIIFAMQILLQGLGYTGMNNNFTMGAWIIGDLTLVCLGGGAFSTGFLLYIFRVDGLKPIINSTVLIGFICYLFTFILLILDIGQPARCWLGYTYPNWGKGIYPQSMLTEVIFCLTVYFCILAVELVPIILDNRFLAGNKYTAAVAHYLHRLMWILAAAGTFLSFFHQGSLGGGMWGSLYARPAWYSPHFFFMAIVAAIAGGTSFMALVPYSAGKILGKELVPGETYRVLTRISGFAFMLYFCFRVYDIVASASHFVPLSDRKYMDLWGGYYGLWMLVLEMLLFAGPLVLLNIKKFRERDTYMVAGATSGVALIVVSKTSVMLHGFSVPNFPWKDFSSYNPSIQEWFITIGAIAIMVLIYMAFVKWFNLFPEE